MQTNFDPATTKQLSGEVFDMLFNPIGTIDEVASLQWTTKDCKPGGFELYVPVNDMTRERYKPKHVLWMGDKTAMIIQSIQESYDSSKGLQYRLQGSSTMSYFASRIVWGMVTNSGTVTSIARNLVSSSAISPSNPNRGWPVTFQLAADQTDYGPNIEFQRTGTRLTDALQELLEPYDLGWTLEYDPFAKTHTFRVIQPKDHSIGNASGNPPVFFSTATEDFLSSQYFYNEADYKNVALIAGAGEGADRRLVAIDDGSSGFNRHEMFVDARDVADTDEEAQPIPTAIYDGMLTERGQSKLDENVLIETFDAKLRTTGAVYAFKQDYVLGDWVTVQDENLGITLRSKITEATETYNANGYSLDIVFGYHQPTLNDKIKNLE